MKGSHTRIVLKIVFIALFLLSTAGAALAAPSGAAGETVRVWVAYGPGRAAEVRQSLNNANATFHYDFADLGAYVVTLPAAALNGIQRNPHVLYVEEDAERYPIAAMPSTAALETLATAEGGQEVPYGIDMVQARDVWDADRNGVIDTGAPTGEGVKLCIIDSGLYTGHEDFEDVNVDGYNGNLPWTTDGFGHGSHVAGTIAAMNNALGVVGVTPGTVQLYIVRVFGDDGAWAYSSTLVDALNRCAAAGADVVSMSLGGAFKNRSEETAFSNAYSGGVLSVAAAGNDGNNRMSYPASYSSVVSVAAIDVNKVVADFSQYNSAVELAAPGVGVLSTVPYLDSTLVTVGGVDYAGGHIEFSARGSASGALVDGGLCTSAGSWSGKVVLCQRGDISFLDKVMNVQNSGGTAAVIYNNEPGSFLGTLGEGYSSTIIGVSLSQEDGQYLVANKLGQTAAVSSIFSSPGSGYEAWDGTSMATPHVSAVAALVWSANPSWTNAEIRNALTSTAEDLGAPGRDVYYGYGLVQARAALDLLTGGTTPTPTPVPTEPPPAGSLSVSVSTNSSSYANGQTVYITVAVTDESAPVAAAAVTVRITNESDKLLTTLTGTTAADGSATFKYKINTRKTGFGTMTVNSIASKTGYTNGTGTTEFTIN